MEDINDNIPTENKRYYLSHAEYTWSKEWDKKFQAIEKYKGNEIMKITQLVCASNMEAAKKAVEKSLEECGMHSVLKVRIDNLIVGE